MVPATKNAGNADWGRVAVAVLKMLFRLAGFALLFAPVILPLLMIQREPLVVGTEGLVFDDIEEAKGILKRFDPRMMSGAQLTTVSVTDREISKAVGAALSRIGRANARVDARPEGVWIGGTVQLPVPDTFLGRYLNVEALIAQSDSELVVQELSIGSLPIPGWLVKPATIYALDWFMGDGKGEPAYASVRAVEVSGSRITVAFQPPENLVADMKAAASRTIQVGNAESIRAYYEMVTKVSRRQSSKPVSLSSYVGPLFALAQERSRTRNPVDENRALILALAIYFGDSRFELLLRDVKTADFSDGGFDYGEVQLQQRHDWVQHFTTTAALQVAAGSGVSNFIGEAKEISDADGPSGFSFTDIAADRTGVRFAEVATRSEASARRLQATLANGVTERDFFPLVADLPEGLSEFEFKAVYGDIDTEIYYGMIRRIDERIADIELYK